MSAYVYILARMDGAEPSAPIKIGISGSPQSRLSTIRTACPFPVICLHQFGPMSREDARWHESGLHDAYNCARLHGEWFDVAPDEIIDLLRYGGVA